MCVVFGISIWNFKVWNSSVSIVTRIRSITESGFRQVEGVSLFSNASSPAVDPTDRLSFRNRGYCHGIKWPEREADH
jgi:hypothetical protein